MAANYNIDKFNDFIRSQLTTAFELNLSEDEWIGIVSSLEGMINEYFELKGLSRFAKVFPGTLTGELFTKLPLTRAFRAYNAKYHITRRQYVPPSFDEVRHILNTAQLMEIHKDLKLITFDGDETLYRDGQYFADENLASFICCLLREGIKIGLVTAAGYEYETEKYEARLVGLMEYFRKTKMPKDALENFFVMGGECNFFMRMDGETGHLKGVDRSLWVRPEEEDNTEKQTRMLDIAEAVLTQMVEECDLRGRVIRKRMAVGMIAGGHDMRKTKPSGSGSSKLRTEILDEACIRVKKALKAANTDVYYCAFNGGNDIFVDCGNKRVGLQRIQYYFSNILPSQTLHVGDQFFKTGNDFQARSCSTCAWVKGPEETKSILRLLLKYKGLISKAFTLHEAGVSAVSATTSTAEEVVITAATAAEAITAVQHPVIITKNIVNDLPDLLISTPVHQPAVFTIVGGHSGFHVIQDDASSDEEDPEFNFQQDSQCGESAAPSATTPVPRSVPSTPFAPRSVPSTPTVSVVGSPNKKGAAEHPAVALERALRSHDERRALAGANPSQFAEEATAHGIALNGNHSA